MRKNLFILACLFALGGFVTGAVHAQQEHSGYMGDDVEDDTFDVYLKAGQGLIATAETTSGELDPVLFLLDSSGIEVAKNDDRDNDTYDSHLIYIAQQPGTYTIVVSNYPETAGNYRLTISIEIGSKISYPPRFILSGDTVLYDTPHFRIHYTLSGSDAVTRDYVRQVAQTVEEVYNIQINQMGWAIPPDDGNNGGNALYDIYLLNLFDHDGEGILGYVTAEWPSLDNPNTAYIEEHAVASYMVMDNDYYFEDVDFPGEEDDPLTLMRATAAHEFHHSIQFGYDALDQNSWYYEASASWMETATFPAQQDATGYVDGVFMYPEICFGGEGAADPIDGFLMYGSWLFIDSLVQEHGDQVPLQLWENIAQQDGWEPLEETLGSYGDTLPQAVARYHAQNLVRDYALAAEFTDFTVWLENIIVTPGEWTFTGRGIQELGANYFEFNLPPGHYRLNVRSKDAPIELWAIMIREGNAVVVPLGNDGMIDTTNYDNVYIMAFNPKYDSDITNCRYADYNITVTQGTSAGSEPGVAYRFNANYFTPPSMVTEGEQRLPNIPRSMPAPIRRKLWEQSAR
jgi:hypothetical protein